MTDKTKKKEQKEKKESTKKVQKDKSKEFAELKDLLQRTQANFENYRKQTEIRMAKMQKFAGKQVLLQVLPIIDNFELALKNKNAEKEHLLNGVELIYAQLNTLLADNGIKAIESKGKFDPYFHEALLKVESDKEENTIIEELQKGFTLHGLVVRHAKVKVSKGKEK